MKKNTANYKSRWQIVGNHNLLSIQKITAKEIDDLHIVKNSTDMKQLAALSATLTVKSLKR